MSHFTTTFAVARRRSALTSRRHKKTKRGKGKAKALTRRKGDHKKHAKACRCAMCDKKRRDKVHKIVKSALKSLRKHV